MKRILPPWRWNLYGPWPPGDTEQHRIPEEQIRPLAERLSKQRAWLSAEENWQAAERALRQKPWRPWVIHFSGEKERSGWDWADLLLKVSVPVLILGLSTAYSIISSSRQEKSARRQKESDVVTNFIKEMQPLVLDKNLKKSASDSEVRGVARGLTLAALSQLQNPERKRLIVRFLLDSGLNTKPGNLFSLSEANLSGADLGGANLTGADLGGANLRVADLRGANLRDADLRIADLRGANLRKCNLRGADLKGVNVRGGNLRDADLRGAKLSNADLRGTDLRGADLRGVTLSGAILSGADLRRAPLRATLRVADLRSVDLKSADLKGVDLRWVDLRGANLKGVNLRGANLSWADISGADLQGLIWNDRTIWPSADRFMGVKNIPADLKKKLGL